MGNISVAAFAVVLGLSACSTAPIVPRIDEFGVAVGDIVKADNATPAAKSLPSRVASARRVDLAREKIRYGSNDRGACDYIQAAVALRSKPFEESCELVPFKLLGDELVPAASQYDSAAAQDKAEYIIKAGDDALLREFLAAGIRAELLNYSKELIALATSKEPEGIGTAAGKAFDALATLEDKVKSSEKATNQGTQKRRAANRTLLTALSTEAIETYRFSLLKRTVREADGFVQAAAVQLGILDYASEQAELQGKRDAFIGELDSQTGATSDYKLVEDAHAALAAADKKASFRRYSQISSAHSAILAALQMPADMTRIAEANKRIVALVEAIQAVN